MPTYRVDNYHCADGLLQGGDRDPIQTARHVYWRKGIALSCPEIFAPVSGEQIRQQMSNCLKEWIYLYNYHLTMHTTRAIKLF